MMKNQVLKLVLLCSLSLSISFSTAIADEFPFEPPKNFVLNPKYIVVHHPVSAKQIAAQLYFDQGLTLIYAFNHDAAYWSFLKASQLDPEMAMAYWGMALALGTNINMNITSEREKVAYEAIQKALKFSEKGSQDERDYIKALSKRYSNDPTVDRKQLAINYSNAMRLLAKKYPDDPDASVLFAESLLDLNPWRQWDASGKPLEGTLEAIRSLTTVLKNIPNHLGANHYYIHAIEASRHPERALTSADRLNSLMPASGHILHMPSHIYLLVGDYHRAASVNEAAIAVDREYIREYGSQGIYPIHYLSHNMYFLSRAYSMEGRFAEAKRAADELVELYRPHIHRMPELEYYFPTPMFVLLRFHRWKDVLELPSPPSELPMATALWHFARGISYAALNNIQKAEDERAEFNKEIAKLPKDFVFGYNQASRVAKIAADLLEAKIAEAKGNPREATEFMQRAVTAQDALNYNEPPDWFFPVRESLGGLLLRQGRHDEAEKVFREDLKWHPRNGRSLFGLKESLAALSRPADLYWVSQEFEAAWKYSNTTLTIQDL